MAVNGIYGLSGSGIDVESMVKAGMLTKQNQYDKMYKKEVQNSWIKSEYADFYSSMYTFKNVTMSSYKMQSKMNAMQASSSDTANVTAKANGAAASMSHKVEVTSLSSNAYMLSTQAISRANTSASSSIYLKDVAFSGLTAVNSYTINGTAYTEDQITSATDADGNTTYTINGGDGTSYASSDVTVAVTGYKVGSGTTTVKSTDTAISLTISDTTDTTATAKQHTVSYTYADLANGKTLNDLAADINATGVNIQASYDSTQDRFSLYNKTGGTANAISVTLAADTAGTNTATLLNNLNMQKSQNGTTSAFQAFSTGSTTSPAAAR